MPYDLWIRSNARPVAFQPERIPIAPIADRYAAQQTAVGYTAADREVLLVEVDDAGKIVHEDLSADDRNAMAQGTQAARGPSIVRWDGAEVPVAIALGTDGEIVDAPADDAAADADTETLKTTDARLTTTRYDSGRATASGYRPATSLETSRERALTDG